DLIDEEDIVRLEARQGGDQVRAAGEGRAAGAVQARAHFFGDDVGEGGLAEAGRPVQEDVLDGLVPLAGGVDGDGEAFDQVRLANVLLHARRAQGPVAGVQLGIGGGGN